MARAGAAASPKQCPGHVPTIGCPFFSTHRFRQCTSRPSSQRYILPAAETHSISRPYMRVCLSSGVPCPAPSCISTGCTASTGIPSVLLQQQHPSMHACQHTSLLLRCPAGFTLTLERLLLRNITLTPASGAGGVPRLLPMGLFSAIPLNVTLMDVRLVVDAPDFQQYLTFFRQQLRSSMDNAGAGPIMHTVRAGKH